MDLESFRKAGHQAIDDICDYYEGISQRPVMAQVEPDFLRKVLPDHAPEHGEEWTTISEDYHKIILPGLTHWQHPNFYAYFPANTTYEGALADLYAAAVSNPGFNWSVSPSGTELELLSMDWMAKMFGLSPEFYTTSPRGGGIILGTASEVAITVAVAARERALSQLEESAPVTVNGHNASDTIASWRGEATSRMIMYGTTQTHSIGAKAALILGIQFRPIEVHAKDDYALRGDQLKAVLEEDTRRGMIPFMLIATVGSTSSGAVDNFAEIESVVKQYPSLWVHVDAAWAGVTFALPEYRVQGHLPAINSFVDSYSTNMHKWGLVTFDCSPMWVRDRAALSSALTVTPEFLKTRHGDAGSVLDLRNMQLFLGRRFRSLKVWFVLRSYGQEGFRKHLRASMAQSTYFNELIQTGSTPFEIVATPRYALTVFRLNPHLNDKGNSLGKEELDALNRKYWEALLQRSDRLLLTQTVLPEIGFCIRMAMGNPRTTMQDVEGAYKILCKCADAVL